MVDACGSLITDPVVLKSLIIQYFKDIYSRSREVEHRASCQLFSQDTLNNLEEIQAASCTFEIWDVVFNMVIF